MILFPPCKINLGLRILSKRTDGYHDLETVFYPVGIKDALEMLPADEVSLHVTGQVIPGDPLSNLCIKAYELLKADFPSIRPVEIHLHKQIPTGAGLGGGSADGAFALRLLNRLFRLGLSPEQLLPYATTLGSDCPFFLYDGPCKASGRGEILEPIQVDLSGYQLVLVNPGIHVPTGWAFSQLGLPAVAAIADRDDTGARPGGGLPPISEWRSTLVNDFEAPVFNAHPEIAQIKQTLYEQGAVYASMSGSGSTVFGIFEQATRPVFHFPENYLFFCLSCG